MTDALDRNNYVMVQVLQDENRTLKARVAELERRLAEQARPAPRRPDPKWQGIYSLGARHEGWHGMNHDAAGIRGRFGNEGDMPPLAAPQARETAPSLFYGPGKAAKLPARISLTDSEDLALSPTKIAPSIASFPPASPL